MSQLSPSPPTKTILILGASYAGLSLTHHLLKHVLPSLPDHKIVLVAPSKDVMCRPACPRAMLADEYFDQSKLFVDIHAQLVQYPSDKWEFVHGAAVGVDHVARTARIGFGGKEQVIAFHALVVATGTSTPSPLLSNGPFRKEAWDTLRSSLPSARKIVVAGGGPTGVEVAGELGSHLNSGSEGRRVEVTLVTSGERILPSLRPALAKTAEKYLSDLGVKILTGTKVVSVEPENAGRDVAATTSSAIVSLSSGEELEADISIPATGTRPNTAFLAKELLDENGKVKTNAKTLRADSVGDRIYALGDCSNAFRPAVHNVLAAVPVLSNNIAKDLHAAAGVGAVKEDKLFVEDTRETQLVPIGNKKGVGAAMGWKLPSWLVWMIKGRDYWIWTTGKLWSGRQW
ncbi:FAD/NAD(P)-binding domain-containing protein [Phaeosphaeriaceae sp. SRC1lsM3a]|nr:FAD/NAD(P)-binding domain-containing protein [Stagonospora sp. SRC1lsM3a]